jgi:hypothetical protein
MKIQHVALSPTHSSKCIQQYLNLPIVDDLVSSSSAQKGKGKKREGKKGKKKKDGVGKKRKTFHNTQHSALKAFPIVTFTMAAANVWYGESSIR